MTKIYVISGDGIGAGKTTLAKLLTDEHLVWSLAGQIRADLQRKFPNYDWQNKSQSYKANTKVRECGNKSVREVMVEYGQSKCAEDPVYWVRLLADKIQGDRHIAAGVRAIATDDLRKLCELQHLRDRFGADVIHWHVINDQAVEESQYQNKELREVAQHYYSWRSPNVS